MLAVAIKDVFRTALTGRCASHQQLADSALPLEMHIPALPCRGGADLARRVFEPLGWQVDGGRGAARPDVPGLGRLALPGHPPGRHGAAGRRAQPSLRAAAGPRRRQALLGGHRRGRQADPGGRRLAGRPPGEGADHPPLPGARASSPGTRWRGWPRSTTPSPKSSTTRWKARGWWPTRSSRCRWPSSAAARCSPPSARPARRRVGDLGCGEGALVRDLLADRAIERGRGHRRVRAGAADRRAQAEARPDERAAAHRLRIFQSSLTYRDDRLAGLDAAVLMEVIEHVDPPRLAALGACRLRARRAVQPVIVTTPNVEHNVRYETLPAGAPAAPDHRFEWTRGRVPRLGRRGGGRVRVPGALPAGRGGRPRGRARQPSWRSSTRPPKADGG